MTGTEGQGVPLISPLPGNTYAGKHRERGRVPQFDRHGPWSAPLPYSCVLLGLGHAVGAGRSTVLSSASAGRQRKHVNPACLSRWHRAAVSAASHHRRVKVFQRAGRTLGTGPLPTISTSQLAGLSFGVVRPFFRRAARPAWRASPRHAQCLPCARAGGSLKERINEITTAP